ncbi:Protein CBG25158 [Caenorhabditis briggsae]|uniref:Protein CBG25158 n=1 Tax=Caenorhabditis briggsae TaxID=6238 RepID=B6IID1_CAEBR|nr:Protein CBG25158 [Caenorhabditis briggsae]CAR99661.1 Protein CBG25158 [Caenorhabditis briggsae]
MKMLSMNCRLGLSESGKEASNVQIRGWSWLNCSEF